MKRNVMRIIGICMILCGAAILSVFGYKKISREIRMHRLLAENVIFEIPSLEIKVPVLEGTDHDTLSMAAGHFPGTGAVGSGNYCIAGHNSTIYAEIFNEIDHIQIGDNMHLIDTDEKRTVYTYVVSEYTIVDPHTVTVLNDFGDDRLTLVTCTDDGKNRQIVVGTLQKEH